MSVKVTYDTIGNITGYYPDDMGYSNIPTPNIEITEEEWQDSIRNPDCRRVDIAMGKLVEYTPPEPETQIITPPVDQNIADLWQAMLAMSAELEALKGGK